MQHTKGRPAFKGKFDDEFRFIAKKCAPYLRAMLEQKVSVTRDDVHDALRTLKPSDFPDGHVLVEYTSQRSLGAILRVFEESISAR